MHTIFIRIIHKRKIKEITTAYSVSEDEWDDEDQSFIIPEDNPFRMHDLMEIRDRITDQENQLFDIVQKLEKEGDYDVQNIVDEFVGKQEKILFSDFVEELYTKSIEKNQSRTARAYRSVANDLKKFTKGENIYLNQINLEFINKYERYLKKAGKSQHTISFYLRNLKAIYNKSIRAGKLLKPIDNPFEYVINYAYKPKTKSKDQLEEVQKKMDDTSDKLSRLVDKTSKYLIS
ncbi:hypothetical protein FACS189437_04040 [Bacteroidia bacterium]|nr:hypothetical protein FACS189437_04040 [Bacteroidia bacterium]